MWKLRYNRQFKQKLFSFSREKFTFLWEKDVPCWLWLPCLIQRESSSSQSKWKCSLLATVKQWKVACRQDCIIWSLLFLTGRFLSLNFLRCSDCRQRNRRPSNLREKRSYDENEWWLSEKTIPECNIHVVVMNITFALTSYSYLWDWWVSLQTWWCYFSFSPKTPRILMRTHVLLFRSLFLKTPNSGNLFCEAAFLVRKHDSWNV